MPEEQTPPVFEDQLPDWAKSVVAEQEPYWQQFAALATRDGRVTGNAVLAQFVNRVYQGETHVVAKVVTDAGNIIHCTKPEMAELFHMPKLIMKDLLPAHVKALTDEARLV